MNYCNQSFYCFGGKQGRCENRYLCNRYINDSSLTEAREWFSLLWLPLYSLNGCAYRLLRRYRATPSVANNH